MGGALLALAMCLASRADALPLISVRGTPVVDGRIDDDAWQRAPWSVDFRQRDPQPGADAAHRTRARVLFDADAIYIAISCETDGRPEARLARRDEIPAGEWAAVMIDTRGEGVSAYSFITNPAGVMADSIVQGDNNFNNAWDSVWNVETTVGAHGWTAEFRIPWRVLRFEGTHPALRIQFERNDYGEGQTVALVPIPTESPRYVASFEQLIGVNAIAPPRILEFRPYVLGRWRLATDPDRLDPTGILSGNVGGDLKFGITNDLIVDATVRPDFGQVEVDPAVVNLGTYELFFNERRPFFVEGTDLFNTPIRILHTRRIGAAPDYPATRYGGEITAIDPNATIWGAAKIAGRIGGLSFLVLDAVTAPAHATESYGAGQRASLVAAPATNWLAARVRAPVGAGSTLGAIFTHVGRVHPRGEDDIVGSVDWDLRAPDGVHRFRGQLAASRAWNIDDGVHSGTGMYLEALRSEDPMWTWTLHSRVYSRNFDPNGLGYLERPNMVQFVFDTTVRTPRPIGAFRSAYVNPWVFRTTNVDNVVIDQGGGLEVGATGRNQWSLGLGGVVWTPRDDDRETRGGINWHNDPSVEGWAWVSSDPRVRVRAGASADVSTRQEGHRGSVTLWTTIIPAPFLTLNLNVVGRSVTNMPRWVENLTDVGGAIHSVFGQQRAQILDVSLRASAAVTRRLTFDLYSQFLAASFRYDHYRELVAPDRLVASAYGGNADYDRVSLTVNAVGRYEYLPGSFFTVVLLHRSALTAYSGDAGFDSGLGLVGSTRPDTMLLAKMTYLWM